MAFNFKDDVKWDVPFDRKKPVPFPKHCRIATPNRAHYEENYLLTSDLTEEEKKSPYAKYYYLGQAMPDKKELEAVEYENPMDPSKAFLIEDYGKHMDVPGCCDVRTGYCVLPNGIGFAAAAITGKGVTAEVMSNYIENFNPPGDLYYKIWCPGNHIRHYESSAIEDVGFGYSYISFTEGLNDEKVGFTAGKNDTCCIGVTGANTICWPLHCPDAEPMHVTELCYHRLVEEGYEIRVTFWIGAEFRDGKTVPMLHHGQPANVNFANILARHSLWETTTLYRNALEFWKDCQE